MELKIAARKSDLARIQAYLVGDALEKQFCELEISYHFSSSLGDKNQNDPLWEMPAQGVFTEDFRQRLVDGDVDMVVHSWKDLPTQNDGSTVLAATLERADHRDLLLVKKSSLAAIGRAGELQVLSSSPRRMYNLEGFLKKAFPGGLDRVVFKDVRGNIQTRLDKLLGGEAHALVVAKAAIDRLLGAKALNRRGEDFFPGVQKIRQAIEKCQWMVLPVSHDPPAAAQGALVVEIARGRDELRAMLEQINDMATFEDVCAEREVLKSYGGGCHQKIGVWVGSHPHGRIMALRGLSDGGEILDSFAMLGKGPDWSDVNEAEIYPPIKSGDLFRREPVAPDDAALREIKNANAILLASSAIPENYLKLTADKVIWTSGVKSWFRFAAKGIWVHGCDDNLGAGARRDVGGLMGEDAHWLSLTHQDSPSMPAIATYRLRAKPVVLNIASGKYFYWRSGSIFRRALELQPQIINGVHACGMGQTHDIISEILGEDVPLFAFVNEEQWRATFGRTGKV